MTLKDIAHYVDDSISSDKIDINQYVTTDSLLQNKEGRTIASNLPPQFCNLTHFMPGDVLVANIRPYLKKVWKADIEGGCSKDVLVIRAKDNHEGNYIYALSLQDTFFENAMLGNKGTQMPRGDKDKIMDFPIYGHKEDFELKIGSLIDGIQKKISLNTRMNTELEAMAKQLYDYWFVQFDFPNENGKPYKSSGGKMVYNEKLKREIPEGWDVKKIRDCINPIERGMSYTSASIATKEGIPMINLACFTKQGNYRIGELKFYNEDYDSSYLVSEGDMLFACTDMTRDADIIGSPIFVNKEFNEYVYSSDLAKIIPNNIEKTYLYFVMKDKTFHNYIKKFASGSLVLHLNIDGVREYPLPIPPNELQRKFNYIYESMAKEINVLTNEIIYFTSLRDSLLPMLMNGQVIVE